MGPMFFTDLTRWRPSPRSSWTLRAEGKKLVPHSLEGTHFTFAGFPLWPGPVSECTHPGTLEWLCWGAEGILLGEGKSLSPKPLKTWSQQQTECTQPYPLTRAKMSPGKEGAHLGVGQTKIVLHHPISACLSQFPALLHPSPHRHFNILWFLEDNEHAQFALVF